MQTRETPIPENILFSNMCCTEHRLRRAVSFHLLLRLRAARRGVCLKMNSATTREVLQTMRIFLASEKPFHFLGLDTPVCFPTLNDISLICHEFADSRLWHYNCPLLAESSFGVNFVHHFWNEL